MVGSSEQQTRRGDQDEPKPIAKAFNCTNCGASVTIRYPGASSSVVCESCKALIDTTSQSYRILSTVYDKTQAYAPIFELGTRGKLFDKEWEIIGFLVRCDAASSFSWEEYLLFNPFYGYRWLTYNSGHWSFVYSIKEKPNDATRSAGPSTSYWLGSKVYYDNQEYKVFFRGAASVAFVLGEFYWKVKVGESVQMEDYICPPRMLSSEQDGTQIVWSVSEYVEPKVIEDAFKPKEPLTVPTTMAPNKPSRATANWKQIKPIWFAFLMLLTGIEFWHLANSADVLVFNQDFPYMTNSKSEKTITSPVFEIPKSVSNVDIELHAPVDNCWFYAYVELVNDETGETHPFERTVEYYHGYSDGESWSEGSTHQEKMFYAVPGGKYYLNIDTEAGGYQDGKIATPSMFTIKIKNDTPTYANWFWCMAFISILPLIAWGQSYGDEVNRWSESDYSPYRSSS